MRRSTLARLAGRISVCVAVVVCLAAPLTAQTNVSGTWMLTVDGPEGAERAALTLVADGDTLKGRIASDRGESAIVGTVKGDNLRFSFDMAGTSITTTATVSGDEIKGDMDYGSGVAGFTGKRSEP